MPALDGLRGAAVAAVLAFHLGYLKGGYLGVDLFFVLSGFLITSLLLAEADAEGRVSLRKFWGRRMRRLLPALLLLLAGIALFATSIAHSIDRPGIRTDALATLGYVANWRTILHGASYWDASLAPSPLQHAWSLAIEEQFYVVWPLVFVGIAALARRRGRSLASAVLGVSVAGAVASAVALVLLHERGASTTRVYEGTDTRAAALLLGVALAAWRARAAERNRSGRTTGAGSGRALEVLATAAAVGLAVMWVRLDGQSPWLYRGGLALAGVLATAVIAGAARPDSAAIGRVLGWRPLRWLGTISYGLYLWHWPAFLALDARNGHYPGLGDLRLTGLAMVAAKVPVSLGLATASFVLLERPIRSGLPRGRWAPLTAGAGAIGVAAAVLLATAGGVHVDRIEPLAAKPPTVVAHAPTVLVTGDSVALSVASRLYADPRRYGVNPVDGTRVGCSVAETGHPVRGFAGDHVRPPACQTYALAKLDEVRPDIVYLLVGARPNDAIQLDGQWVRACHPEFDATYRSATTALVRRFRAAGAQVVLGTVLHPGAASFPVAGSDERIDCVNRVIRSIARSVRGVHVVDVNELLCADAGACLETVAGEPVRTDGIHFDRGPGGDLVADWIVEQMLRVTGLRPGRDAARPTG